MTAPPFGEAEYLCYEVIKQGREQYGEDWDLPETAFNKLCYIADRELREEGLEVGLPVHWYIYGGVLTDSAMEGGFYELVDESWSGRRGKNVVLNEEVGRSDFEVQDDRASEIRQEAEHIVTVLGGFHGVAIPQDYQYEKYAPNDFVRCLHEFRDYLDNLDEEDALAPEDYVGGVDFAMKDILAEPVIPEESGISHSEDTNSEIRDYLDQLMTEYPEDVYSRMDDQFLEWENLSWQMAKNGFYDNLYEFMESFWTAFSRVELRVEHNQNVPREIVVEWQRGRSEEMERFQSKIEKYREIVLEHREETAVLDTVSEPYSETVRDMFDQVPEQE